MRERVLMRMNMFVFFSNFKYMPQLELIAVKQSESLLHPIQQPGSFWDGY